MAWQSSPSWKSSRHITHPLFLDVTIHSSSLWTRVRCNISNEVVASCRLLASSTLSRSWGCWSSNCGLWVTSPLSRSRRCWSFSRYQCRQIGITARLKTTATNTIRMDTERTRSSMDMEYETDFFYSAIYIEG